MGAQNEWEEPRSIWEDESDELGTGDEIAIMRSPVFDDTPVPERVRDLPKRQEPKRLSSRLEEFDADKDDDDWTLDKPSRGTGEAFLKAVEVVKILSVFAILGGVLAGLGWACWWAFQQYGVI